jgi:sterol desaturase/sphingolipid hydroxylase (fatty acid hydroxylase superfamily)
VIALVIVGSLVAVAVWELCRPRRRREFPAVARRLANLGMWLANLALAALFFAPADTFRAQFETIFGIELPRWPIANPLAGFVAAFLLLDLLIYLVHRCQHAVPWLWRLHALHHSDPDVDVTTSVRHHPFEYLLATAVYWLTTVVFGLPMAAVTGHALVVFAAAALTHGNIRLPQPVERWLQPVVITVDLHLVHHSIVPAEYNANFGGVLSVWDRMFGTYLALPRGKVTDLRFGVAALPRTDGIKPWAMLATPWRLGRRARRAPVAG